MTYYKYGDGRYIESLSREKKTQTKTYGEG